MATDQFSGPVDYLVFAFDEGVDLGEGLRALLERVEQGIVEILDIELIDRDGGGAPVKRPFSDLSGTTGLDLSVFDGAESGILDSDDLEAIASELRDGQFALAVVYEDRSLAAAAEAWAGVGAAEMFSGGVDIADLERALQEGGRS